MNAGGHLHTGRALLFVAVAVVRRRGDGPVAGPQAVVGVEQTGADVMAAVAAAVVLLALAASQVRPAVVGVGARMVSDVLKLAAGCAPCTYVQYPGCVETVVKSTPPPPM